MKQINFRVSDEVASRLNALRLENEPWPVFVERICDLLEGKPPEPLNLEQRVAALEAWMLKLNRSPVADCSNNATNTVADCSTDATNTVADDGPVADCSTDATNTVADDGPVADCSVDATSPVSTDATSPVADRSTDAVSTDPVSTDATSPVADRSVDATNTVADRSADAVSTDATNTASDQSPRPKATDEELIELLRLGWKNEQITKRYKVGEGRLANLRKALLTAPQ